MSYPDDLIAQARHLIDRGRFRPKQADLRRAVSAAYYALFHELTATAAKQVTARTAPAAVIGTVARTMQHRTMRAASLDLSKTPPGPKVRGLLAGVTVPQELADVADGFVKLQERRHLADYDLTAALIKADVMRDVGTAEDAIALCRALRADPAFARFLFALHAHDRLRGG